MITETLNMEKLTTKVVDKTGNILRKMVQYDYDVSWEDLTMENLKVLIKALRKHIKKDLIQHGLKIKTGWMYDSDFKINVEHRKYKMYIRYWVWFNPIEK